MRSEETYQQWKTRMAEEERLATPEDRTTRSAKGDRVHVLDSCCLTGLVEELEGGIGCWNEQAVVIHDGCGNHFIHNAWKLRKVGML